MVITAHYVVVDADAVEADNSFFGCGFDVLPARECGCHAAFITGGGGNYCVTRNDQGNARLATLTFECSLSPC